MKYNTPREVYESKVISMTFDLAMIDDYFPDMELYQWTAQYPNQDRLVSKTHFYQTLDYRRYAEVCSLWFNDIVISIEVRAGREGRDHRDTIVLNREEYKEAYKYIMSFLDPDIEVEDEFDSDEPTPRLTEFYGFYFDLSGG